jgi:hypothetical protein
MDHKGGQKTYGGLSLYVQAGGTLNPNLERRTDGEKPGERQPGTLNERN